MDWTASDERDRRDVERHYNGNKAARPKSMINMVDSSSDDAEKSSVLQTHSLREFEQHLNDLKKENFSLKLRIYFLEERFQQKFEDSSSEDVHRRNIELKVEVESLKQDLQERQEQLDEALTTAESLTNQNEVEEQRRCEERQQEIGHMQEILETKIQLLQEEAQLARSEAEKMASLADSETRRCLALERRMMMEMQGGNESLSAMAQLDVIVEKDRLIAEQNETVCRSEQKASDLSSQRDVLTAKLTELEEQVQSLTFSLQQKEKHIQTLREELAHGKSRTEQEMQRLIEEQQCQLAEYENAAGQCVSELQKAQQQVQSLQTKIRESETSNKKLQQRLRDMESELRSVREAVCGQERTIQTLSDSLNTKDCEITDLHRLTEEQNELLHSLKQQNNHFLLQQQQVSGVAPSRLQADLLDLQGSLFSAQLELQGLQRAQQQGQRREDDLSRGNQRLQADLQEALQHHQEAETHNHDLLAALERARFEIQQMEEKWRDERRQREKEVEEREKTIRELKTSLEHKEQLLLDYSELVDAQKEPAGNKDNLIFKLKQRIQERDRALERAVDEKFTCMEQKEDEVRKLQLLLREKERDLEKLRCVLSNNEETITSLELLLRGKGLELEQVCEAWRSAQGVQREREESHMRSLRERDTLINQLQTSLHTRTKEAEDMTAVLLSKVSVGSSEVAEELKSRLQLKERLFQELLSDRTRQTQEHHSQVQNLLNTINSREQYIKDSAGRVGQVMAEQTGRLQELRRQLGSSNPQLTEGDTQVLQDELQLTLRKEREAQNQLTALRSTLASHQDRLQAQVSDIEALSRTVSIKEEIIKDLQVQLVEPSGLPLVEKLTLELQVLREKVEHHNATCIKHKQAVLDPLVPMETGHADFGGFTSEDGEEEDEDCSSEFADSAEDEERSKLTAQSLLSVQSCDQHTGLKGCQDAVAEGPG
ncbi:myomegalin [Pimephales promelas]|nr:myomegalin [Pimephales promelas]